MELRATWKASHTHTRSISIIPPITAHMLSHGWQSSAVYHLTGKWPLSSSNALMSAKKAKRQTKVDPIEVGAMKQ